MDILINGSKIDYTIEAEKNLGEILGAIESACEESGMTITGIRVDGSTFGADSLDPLFAREPSGISTIELDTINSQDIIGMLRDFGTRMSGFVPQLKEIPVQLQTGKDMTVLETIHRFSLDLQG